MSLASVNFQIKFRVTVADSGSPLAETLFYGGVSEPFDKDRAMDFFQRMTKKNPRAIVTLYRETVETVRMYAP